MTLFSVSIVLLLNTLSLASTPVAVTVDDLFPPGGDPGGLSPLASVRKLNGILKKEGIKGVWAFVTLPPDSPKAPGTEEAIAAWRKQGHLFGNHTSDHSDANKLNSVDFLRKVDAVSAFVGKANGKPIARRFFRYPFLREGETREKREEIRAGLAERGLSIAPVTVPFPAWAWNDAYKRCLKKKDRKKIEELRRSFLDNAGRAFSSSQRLARKLFGRDSAQVLVLHPGVMELDLLPELFSLFRRRGARFVSLEEALRDTAFQSDPGIAFDRSVYFFHQLAIARGVPPEDLVVSATELVSEMAGICL